MRYKVEDIDDITDTRVILQSSPKGFSRYMTYIILLLLFGTVVWSIFADKEVSIKASGVVRPADDIQKVSSTIGGQVVSLNVKDGDMVSEGDVLLVIDAAQYTLQKKIYGENIEKKNNELELVTKLKESVQEGINKFDSNKEEEKEYYAKCKLYLDNINLDNGQQVILDKEKEELNNKISELNQLRKSIEDEKCYVNSNSSSYFVYKNYMLQIDEYRNTKQSSDIVELEKMKNNTIMSIVKEIQENQSKLEQLSNSHIGSNYKEQYLSNVNNNIDTIKSAISELRMNLDMASEMVDASIIKAPCDGKINMLSEVKAGGYIQIGSEIASIALDNDCYVVETYINNQDLGPITDGQEVAIEINSLSASEYGYIKSNLNNISVDTKVMKNNSGANNQSSPMSYYTAKCPIKDKEVRNRKGEKAQIKSGMYAQVRIITRRVSYLRYFMEKMDIL